MIQLSKHEFIRKLCASFAVKLATFGMFLGSAVFLVSLLGQTEDAYKSRAFLLAAPGILFVAGIVADIFEKFFKDSAESDKKIDLIYILASIVIYFCCIMIYLFSIN